MEIKISEKIKQACPNVHIATLSCKVVNSETGTDFWNDMEAEVANIKSTYKLEEINKRLHIAATRKIYKTLGKDPNRYRPSAEALCRRILRGIDIYQVSTLVDIINLVSINSGLSIGAFDAKKIQGDSLLLDAGRADDEFVAIGRGMLNIEGLPVYRDKIGGIGTPTSDNERTKLNMDTTNMFVIFNGYAGDEGLKDAIDLAEDLLSRYAEMTEAQVCYYF